MQLSREKHLYSPYCVAYLTHKILRALTYSRHVACANLYAACCVERRKYADNKRMSINTQRICHSKTVGSL